MKLHFCWRNKTDIYLLSLIGGMRQKGNWVTALCQLQGLHWRQIHPTLQ